MVERQTRGFLKSLKTLVHIVLCFFVMYLYLVIFLLPILFMTCYRFILTLIFYTFYRGRYELVERFSACLAVDRVARMWTISLFAYIDGPCDIEFLRRRIHQIFTSFKGKNGSRPYEVMLCGLVRKFGFFCWENMRDSFDIKYHIRYLPGCSDPDQIYTETEVFEAAANLADDLWPESKPRWEFLVVPKMKKDDSDVVCSAIHFRFNHGYLDGISMGQIIRLCFADKPSPEFMFDPVNPPISPMPLWMKLITCLQVVFLGPWATLKLMSTDEQNVFSEPPVFNGKFFGRTKMDIPIGKIKEIRQFYNCSTTAIQHFAFTGALRKLVQRKGFPIPDDLFTTMIFALLPYPHEYPQNHLTFLMEKSPIGRDGLNRLHAMEKICSRNSRPMNYYTFITAKLFLQWMGSFPVAVLNKAANIVKITYILSNVPGFKDIIYFNGNSVLNIFGMGALTNILRYAVGATCYENKFTFGLIAEHSKLVEDREDFNYLIDAFENEMKMLMESVHSTQLTSSN